MINNPPKDPASDEAETSSVHASTEPGSITPASTTTENGGSKDIERPGSSEGPSIGEAANQLPVVVPATASGIIAPPQDSDTTAESESLEAAARSEEPHQLRPNADSGKAEATNNKSESVQIDERSSRDVPAPPESVNTLTVPKDGTPSVSESNLRQHGAPLKAQSWHHLLATDILDKQYRLYSWNDSKALSLITTNSVLLAAIGFLFKECIPDRFSLASILLALFFVAFSLYFSLKQVIPQGSSGKSGKGPNVRALRSITEFDKWETYHLKMLSMDEDEAFECAARQIYGMALNNDASRKTTTRGVKLTFLGIVFILLSTFGVALSARDIHPLGEWAKKSPESKPIVEKPLSIGKPAEDNAASSNNSTPSPSASESASRPTPTNGIQKPRR